MRIGIIGGGKVGRCLASYLGKGLVGITANSLEHSRQLAAAFATEPCTNKELVERAEVLLLTVPDRLIGTVAEQLASEATAMAGAQAPLAGKTFLHCSGSMGLEELAPLQLAGAHVGSLHPLQSFAGGATQLAGVYMAVDGDEAACEAATAIATALGGHPFRVPAAERAAYHAAACICSNYAVAVEALAQRLMSRWLGDEAATWQALLPLFKGTAANLERTASPRTALTGPIARGDATTVAKHLAVLPPELLDAYCSLGLATTKLALANGTIDKEVAAELTQLLKR
ncbi:MAG: Rossmann-like and DUF2520 domain-containing protein [Phascolarctobacterium sp.]|nr:Rossmann-like and DUF2520 domain-containing protein [Phascolarctobacterium sp.]